MIKQLIITRASGKLRLKQEITESNAWNTASERKSFIATWRPREKGAPGPGSQWACALVRATLGGTEHRVVGGRCGCDPRSSLSACRGVEKRD
jgi:hypothetical protein